MVKILFTRHGETLWNVEKRCQGQTDIELNNRGLSQAKVLAQRLKNYSLDAIYSSDLIRAYNTAEEIKSIKDNEIPLHKEPLLREFHFGKWEGLTNEEIKTNYGELLNKRALRPDVDIPDGEKYSDLVERCKSFVEKCYENHNGQTVLAVTHSVFIKALLHHYLQLPWPIVKNNMYLDNCSLTVLKVSKDKVVVERINDSAHFEKHGDVVEARH